MNDIAADTYDVAVTVYLLAYLEDLQQESVIREMVRIVKPGDRFVFSQTRLHMLYHWKNSE